MWSVTVNIMMMILTSTEQGTRDNTALEESSLSNKGKPRIAEGCSCEAVLGVVFVKLIRVNPNRCQHRHV